MKKLTGKLTAMPFCTWLLLAALTPTLVGCFGAAAVGMGAGVMLAVDRRPTETVLTDEGIEVRGANRVNAKFGDRAHVNIISFNRNVLLTGEVADAAAKAEAEKLLSGVPNVKAISNELQVSGVSSLGVRSNDAYITSKVKARFVDASQFSANHVKVVTEAGTVFLIGLVTQREADAAVEVARTTGGVMKVIRMFEIISEEDARRIDHPPTGNAAAKKQP
ncbi:MAG: BON domain-containing protein [Proteobacteria bacterium]|nr:BON domain-containing protein [Pseudomonadota bacterium]